jgi:transcriptional regulator with XRE-family HTH domain
MRRKNKTIPTKAHPLVQQIFMLMNEQGRTYQELADKAGVKPRVLERWRLNVMPQLHTLELVLGALGARLTINKENGNKNEWNT